MYALGTLLVRNDILHTVRSCNGNGSKLTTLQNPSTEMEESEFYPAMAINIVKPLFRTLPPGVTNLPVETIGKQITRIQKYVSELSGVLDICAKYGQTGGHKVDLNLVRNDQIYDLVFLPATRDARTNTDKHIAKFHDLLLGDVAVGDKLILVNDTSNHKQCIGTLITVEKVTPQTGLDVRRFHTAGFWVYPEDVARVGSSARAIFRDEVTVSDFELSRRAMATKIELLNTLMSTLTALSPAPTNVDIDILKALESNWVSCRQGISFGDRIAWIGRIQKITA